MSLKKLDNRNWQKSDLYKSIINKCCIPNCKFGYNLETHHIIPLKRGGKDEFENYIVLCEFCHRHTKIHRYSEDKRLILYVYKFFIESSIIDATSDDYSDQEYWIKLKSIAFKIPDTSLNKVEETERIKIIDLSLYQNKIAKEITKDISDSKQNISPESPIITNKPIPATK